MVFKNQSKFINFIANSNFNICFLEKITKDCCREIYKNTENGLELFEIVQFEDYQTTELLHISADGSKLYLKDSRGENTAALIEVNLLNNSRKILAIDSDGKADLSKIYIHPETLEIEAACFTFEKDSWKYFNNFDEQTKLFFENLATKKQYLCDIISRSFIDEYWIISLSTEKKVEYFIYQKKALAITRFIGGTHFQSKILSHIITTKDGLNLVSYLTLPPSVEYCLGQAYKPLPMVLNANST